MVALVVTIVVLLILSGVTISTLLGNNGIIAQAKKAAELTNRATVVSSVQLDILMAEMEGEITQDKLEEILNKYGTIEKNDPENPDKVTGLKVEGVTDSIPIEELYLRGTTGGGGDTPVKPEEPDTTAPEVSISLSATSTETGTTITATVTHIDNKSQVDIEKCKYLYNTTSGNLETTNTKWDTASTFNTNPQNIDLLATTEGTYYLHVLTVDTAGNKGEKVSDAIKVTASGTSAADIANEADKSKYYGKVVDYTVGNSSLQSDLEADGIKWRIFYAGSDFSTDGKNRIYLITNAYIPYANIPKSSGGHALNAVDSSYYPRAAYFDNILGDYTGSASITDSTIKKLNNSYFSQNYASTNNNMKAVAYMCDTNAWSVYKGAKADYAIGGPTIEILMKSYSQLYRVNYQSKATSNLGYKITKDGGLNWASSYSGMLSSNDSMYVIDTSNCNEYAYWLATSSAGGDGSSMMLVTYSNVGWDAMNMGGVAFRPLVCLSSDVRLEEQSDGTFKIK